MAERRRGGGESTRTGGRTASLQISARSLSRSPVLLCAVALLLATNEDRIAS